VKKHYRTYVKIGRAKKPEHSCASTVAGALDKIFGRLGRPAVVAVGGPGGIGKSTFAAKLKALLADAEILKLDDYKTSREDRRRKNLHGPHPEANRFSLVRTHLEALRRGEAIEKPVYCRKKGGDGAFEQIRPARFIIAEGEISTYRELHDLVDFSVFIDSHWKTQLNTRITRDIEERGYSPEKAIEAFLHSNLREFAAHGAESKNWADVHVHCSEDYQLVIDAVCSKRLSFLIGEIAPELSEQINKQASSSCT
jgi:uridine kinase